MQIPPPRYNERGGLRATASDTGGEYRSGRLHGVFSALISTRNIRWSTGNPSMQTVYSYVDMFARRPSEITLQVDQLVSGQLPVASHRKQRLQVSNLRFCLALLRVEACVTVVL